MKRYVVSNVWTKSDTQNGKVMHTHRLITEFYDATSKDEAMGTAISEQSKEIEASNGWSLYMFNCIEVPGNGS